MAVPQKISSVISSSSEPPPSPFGLQPAVPPCWCSVGFPYNPNQGDASSECDVCWQCKRSPNAPPRAVSTGVEGKIVPVRDEYGVPTGATKQLPTCLCRSRQMGAPSRQGNYPQSNPTTTTEYGPCTGGASWYPVGVTTWPRDGRVAPREF